MCLRFLTTQWHAPYIKVIVIFFQSFPKLLRFTCILSIHSFTILLDMNALTDFTVLSPTVNDKHKTFNPKHRLPLSYITHTLSYIMVHKTALPFLFQSFQAWTFSLEYTFSSNFVFGHTTHCLLISITIHLLIHQMIRLANLSTFSLVIGKYEKRTKQ